MADRTPARHALHQAHHAQPSQQWFPASTTHAVMPLTPSSPSASTSHPGSEAAPLAGFASTACPSQQRQQQRQPAVVLQAVASDMQPFCPQTDADAGRPLSDTALVGHRDVSTAPPVRQPPQTYVQHWQQQRQQHWQPHHEQQQHLALKLSPGTCPAPRGLTHERVVQELVWRLHALSHSTHTRTGDHAPHQPCEPEHCAACARLVQKMTGVSTDDQYEKKEKRHSSHAARRSASADTSAPGRGSQRATSPIERRRTTLLQRLRRRVLGSRPSLSASSHSTSSHTATSDPITNHTTESGRPGSRGSMGRHVSAVAGHADARDRQATARDGSSIAPYQSTIDYRATQYPKPSSQQRDGDSGHHHRHHQHGDQHRASTVGRSLHGMDDYVPSGLLQGHALFSSTHSSLPPVQPATIPQPTHVQGALHSPLGEADACRQREQMIQQLWVRTQQQQHHQQQHQHQHHHHQQQQQQQRQQHHHHHQQQQQQQQHSLGSPPSHSSDVPPMIIDHRQQISISAVLTSAAPVLERTAATCDVEFHLAPGHPPLYGMSAVLCHQSRVLAAMIDAALPVSHSTAALASNVTAPLPPTPAATLPSRRAVRIDKWSPSVFDAFLAYMHTGRVAVSSTDMLPQLAACAGAFNVPRLAAHCQQLMPSGMSTPRNPSSKGISRIPGASTSAPRTASPSLSTYTRLSDMSQSRTYDSSTV
ncbi:hypothetical protein PTSG_10974 [Salpingoeca rosetta]|uniref:BTB domain-containing protein n=1 Tax=Salpingoeca rosetta (strain ATCC 50818 / BSB-021) TaxID=946362 RepID=F2USC2_SALR5|nr:uncharacterized protein PTSG_10974 [Salpingoeca rosetta]EGD81031.1 hypothetical protein PTSG_10974 [Salpingoeca rosetta]|eukprot:XP_004987901.1 hypothetical protein PTSG_10974 [Salpingoeca rosetta]